MPIYMQLPKGYEGESTDAGFVNWHKVDAYSWGVSNGGGRANFSDLSVSLSMCRSISKLMLACAQGAHFPSVILYKRSPNGQAIRFTLEDVLVSSLELGDSSSGGNDIPANISFDYEKITIEVDYLRQDGSIQIQSNWFDLASGGGG